MRLALNTYAYADITLRARYRLPECPKAEDGNLRKSVLQRARQKKAFDNSKTAPQGPALSAQPPPREAPLTTAPRQEQTTPKLKQIAKITTAVVLAAIAIVLCAYAFILTKQ
jgi:hypothetical protein